MVQREVAFRNLKLKKMLLTFFDIKGVVHFKFIPQAQSTSLLCGNIGEVT